MKLFCFQINGRGKFWNIKRMRESVSWQLRCEFRDLEMTNLIQNNKKIATKKKLVGEGDSCQKIYEIASGRVRIQKGNVVLYRLGVGEVFGELPYILKTSISYAVFAEEDCKLYQVLRKEKKNIPLF